MKSKERLLVKDMRGVNLGGWLMMEGYLLGGPNIAEHSFKDLFKKKYGAARLSEFELLFRNNFIRESDIKFISSKGANCLRVPFHYSLIEKKPYKYCSKGLGYLDRVIDWSQKYGLGVILDLHAACGCQNNDWHSDSSGMALLWKNKSFRLRTVELWRMLADRYKYKRSLIGYDVLNEPVLSQDRVPVLRELYRKIVRAIQDSDKERYIFLEGHLWAQKIDFLAELLSEKVKVSVHAYQPLEYTFNFTPGYVFPGRCLKKRWDHHTIAGSLKRYHDFCQRHKTDIFVGEFGINWRGGLYGELDWVRAMVRSFKDYGFGYTYWTYKGIANHIFPDGLLRNIRNCDFINRPGPDCGWMTYLGHWKKNRQGIVDFWKSESFVCNDKLFNALYGKR